MTDFYLTASLLALVFALIRHRWYLVEDWLEGRRIRRWQEERKLNPPPPAVTKEQQIAEEERYLTLEIVHGRFDDEAQKILSRMAAQKARKLMNPTIPDPLRWGLKKDGTPKAKPGRKVGYKAKKPEPVTNPSEVANPVET